MPPYVLQTRTTISTTEVSLLLVVVCERLAVIRPTGHELQTFQEVTRTYLQAVVDRVRLRSSLTYLRYDTIRYDTRCYFNVRSKADMSRLNLYRTENN